MRLWGHLNRDPWKEGEEFSKLHLAIEQRTLPVTKYLDRLITNPKGELTMTHGPVRFSMTRQMTSKVEM